MNEPNPPGQVDIDAKTGLRWLAALAGTVLLVVLVMGGLRLLFGEPPTSPEADTPQAAAPSENEVRLGINYGEETSGDGTQPVSLLLPYSEGTTLLVLMQQARQQSDWPEFEYKGEGEMALLEQISGVRNEGGDGNHWLFYVNGRLAPQGFGSQVQGGNDILWNFGKYE